MHRQTGCPRWSRPADHPRRRRKRCPVPTPRQPVVANPATNRRCIIPRAQIHPGADSAVHQQDIRTSIHVNGTRNGAARNDDIAPIPYKDVARQRARLIQTVAIRTYVKKRITADRPAVRQIVRAAAQVHRPVQCACIIDGDRIRLPPRC